MWYKMMIIMMLCIPALVQANEVERAFATEIALLYCTSGSDILNKYTIKGLDAAEFQELYRARCIQQETMIILKQLEQWKSLR